MQTIRESLWQPLDTGCNVPAHNTKLPQLSSTGSTTASDETVSLNNSSLERAAYSSEHSDQWDDSWNKTTAMLLTRQEALWNSGAGQLHFSTLGDISGNLWESQQDFQILIPEKHSPALNKVSFTFLRLLHVSNMFPLPFTKEFWGLSLFFSLLCS